MWKALMLYKLLMDTAGDGGAGGGGQGNSTLLGGGGGTGDSSGGAGAGGGAAGGTGSGGDPNNSGGSGGAGANDWRSSLPTELQTDPALTPIKDVASLAKSYLNAQKLVGAEKIAIPSKHATDEDWKQIFTKLGLPQDVKDYGVKVPEGAKFDEVFTTGFAAAAHKAGILPKQAQAMVNWFNEANNQQMSKFAEGQAAERGKQLEALKTEWGQAFDVNVSRARQVLKSFGDEKIMKYLDSSGLGNDAQLVRLLAKVGEGLKEDGVIGEGSAGAGMKTPAEAIKSINTIQADKDHPYNIKSHPNHKAAVEEVQSLYQMAYPTPKK